MRLDASGNLGLGVTPSASGTNTRAFQLTNYGTLSGNGNIGSMSMAANAYESADNTWNRVNATSAGLYQISYTGQHSWYYTGASTANSAITWTQAMTLNASGQLIIGNTVASNVGLTIYGSNAATIYQTANTGTGAANGFYVGHTGDISYIWNYNNYPTVFATNNTERMRITSGGNVLIGTTTDSGHKLRVFGDGANFGNGGDFYQTINSGASGSYYLIVNGAIRQTIASTGAATFTNSLSIGSDFSITNGSQKFYTYQNSPGQYRYIGTEYAPGNGNNRAEIRFGIDGADTRTKISFHVANGGGTINEALSIGYTNAATFTGSVTATSFFESSDSRLKTLIQDNYQTKGIASITPKLYTKNGKVELGYYAQDFVGILDSAVSKGSDDMLSLSYREVLVAKVYALEQRIKELENK
jgi:hypothetical protein